MIFAKHEVLSLAGKPFSVFTPYKNAWLKKLAAQDTDFYSRAYPVQKYADKLASHHWPARPTLVEMGFQPDALPAGVHGGSSAAGGGQTTALQAPKESAAGPPE